MSVVGKTSCWRFIIIPLDYLDYHTAVYTPGLVDVLLQVFLHD